MQSGSAAATQFDAGALYWNPSLRQGWPTKEKGPVQPWSHRTASSPPWQALLVWQGQWENPHFYNSQVHTILAVSSTGEK